MIEILVRNLMKYGFDQIHAAPSGMRSPSRAETETLSIAYAPFRSYWYAACLFGVHWFWNECTSDFADFTDFPPKNGLSTAEIGVYQSSDSAQAVIMGLG